MSLEWDCDCVWGCVWSAETAVGAWARRDAFVRIKSTGRERAFMMAASLARRAMRPDRPQEGDSLRDQQAPNHGDHPDDGSADAQIPIDAAAGKQRNRTHDQANFKERLAKVKEVGSNLGALYFCLERPGLLVFFFQIVGPLILVGGIALDDLLCGVLVGDSDHAEEIVDQGRVVSAILLGLIFV